MKVRENEVEWYHLLPLIFIITILPLIVHLKIVPLTGASYDFWNGAKDNLDFFSYYKGIWLLIAATTALFIFIVRLFQSDPKLIKQDLKFYYLAGSVYLIFVILSTILSNYPSIAFNGFTDRYEGVYILVTYILIFFFTTSMVSNEKQVKLIIASLLSGATIIAIIGLFQYIGFDLWKSNIGKSLMLPAKNMNMAGGLTFQFSKHTIYATLYHTDYVGSYMAMLFPFSFAMLVLSKNKWIRIGLAFLTILMGINWLGCNSRAGMVGGILALIIFFISINKRIIKYWKLFSIGLIVAIAIFLSLNQLSHGYLGSRVLSLTNVRDTSKSADQDVPLKSINISGNKGSVITNTETLNFQFENNQLKFTDENNRKIESSYDNINGKITLNDPRYKDYNLIAGMSEDKYLFKLDKGNIKLLFELKQSGISLIDNKGKVVDLKPVETWGFKGNERLGSSRGYIWSRSIPLLKHTLFLGYGPDTFAAYFPQNDIIGKMYAYYGDMWQIVDKPHDLYLQIALNTGVISLLAVLMLFGLYIVRSFRIFVNNEFEDFLTQVGIAVFVAIIGYLGAAFFNDSIVSVAPVFWVLFGLGVSINHIICTREKKNKGLILEK